MLGPITNLEMPIPKKFNKQLLCISKTGYLFGLENHFSKTPILNSIEKINEFPDFSYEDYFDAVIYVTSGKIDIAIAIIKETKELLKNHHVPFIVIGHKLSVKDKTTLFKNGIDDCYSDEIDFDSLNKRIDFLNQFKKIEKTISTSNSETYRIKTPILKRVFNIAVSGTALLLLSPLFIFISIIIKLESKGPIFYISKRAGSGYKIFNFYKFRSMFIDADKQLEKLKSQNQYSNIEGKDNAPTFFKIKNDPRVTRVGRFLRNTSLDEIPQLINVLKGDMSIVGNRPLPLYEAEQLTNDECAMRFFATAGITGLWQVTKRGTNDMSDEERVSLDIKYATKSSVWTDFKLIYKTFPALFQQENV